MDFAVQTRLTGGNIRRVGSAAAGFARLAGRSTIQREDVRRACRTLQAARLETLAVCLPTQGAWHDLAVDDRTREELTALTTRCRFREQLASTSAAVAQGNVGVRALFTGSSGTGKTLAARLVAASLGKDLYRVDLSAAVNKYLGETEKNLNQAFAAAEELDVVLLLDEGDALMANRTDVGSSNDRYANLETNFLLQRIESFDGILLVTSNAADRIDRAFARRMDVVVNFRAPDEWRRYDILKLHLAAEDVDDDWLQQIACRCALTGGQLRNVAADARLLALQEGGTLRPEHLFAALAREYDKRGATCPLRPTEGAGLPPAARVGQ
jgi:SpoVK/Ycf46/Vps4 family AAA+-type ATPase